MYSMTVLKKTNMVTKIYMEKNVKEVVRAC